MITRRGFLKALAATSLAPFIPAIAASPMPVAATLDDILAGRVPLYLSLCGPNGVIEELGRVLVHLDRPLTFDFVSCHCLVTHARVETGDSSWHFDVDVNRAPFYVRPADTIIIHEFKMTGD